MAFFFYGWAVGFLQSHCCSIKYIVITIYARFICWFLFGLENASEEDSERNSDEVIRVQKYEQKSHHTYECKHCAGENCSEEVL